MECLLHQGTRKVSHRSPREARDLISLRDFWAKACLQSAACKEAGDEIEKAGKTGIGLFVASCDAAECLEGTEEVLDQMTPFVHFGVMGDAPGAIGFGRNDCCSAAFIEVGAQLVVVESLVA